MPLFGRKKIKAPWPNSTKEEDEAYARTLSLGNAEFEHEVADAMGPYGRKALDSSRANLRTVVKRPDLKWTTLGSYIPDDYYLDKGYYDYIKWKTGEPIVADEVNVIGAENTTPEIWAHEYRHRYVEKKRDKEGTGTEFLRKKITRPKKPAEKINLLWDGFRARNSKSWGRAVDLWRSDVRENEGRRLTKEQAEMDLRRELNKYKDDMIEQEALSVWQGSPYEIDSIRQLYTDNFYRRVNSWNNE
jgi:hypothetical protein